MFGSLDTNVVAAKAAALFYFDVFAALGNNTGIFGPYWSLSLEEQFYAVFPLLLILVPNKRYRIIAMTLADAALVALPPFAGPLRADPIFYGVIIYHFALPAPRLPRLTTACLTVALVVALLTAQTFLDQRVPYWLAYLMPGIFSAILVWLASQQKNHIPSLGRHLDLVFDWIGTRSYGLYLIHLPAYMAAGEITWRLQLADSPLGRGGIALVLMLAATEICFRYLEVPLRSAARTIAHTIVEPRVTPELSAVAPVPAAQN
jgi:peptidoglycan/LPS O-acetylase OafA/YrhL